MIKSMNESKTWQNIFYVTADVNVMMENVI